MTSGVVPRFGGLCSQARHAASRSSGPRTKSALAPEASPLAGLPQFVGILVFPEGIWPGQGLEGVRNRRKRVGTRLAACRSTQGTKT